MRFFPRSHVGRAVALAMAAAFGVFPLSSPAQNLPSPALTYSTYLGGGSLDSYGETGYATALGADGFVYVVGASASVYDFPFTHRLFTNNPGADRGTFVGKFDPTNKTFVYMTFVPACTGVAIAADAAGNAYFAGDANLFFPTTNAFASNYEGGDYDAFAAKLSPDGSRLLYATFLGGSTNDLARNIAVDSLGEAIVLGITESTNFPTTANGVIAAQSPGGWRTFLTKLNAAGNQLLSSTYLGGAGEDLGTGLAVDGSGNIYVAGGGSSTNFVNAPAPVVLGATGVTHAFVAKIAPDLSAVSYLTFLGGRGDTSAAAVAVDAAGQAYLFGQTSGTNFPVTPNAPQPQYAGGSQDDFVVALSPSGASLTYATYLGGLYSEDLREIRYVDNAYFYIPIAGAAVDGAGNFYVAGQTRSYDMSPAALNADLHTGDSAGYVAKYDPTGALLYVRYLGNSLSATATGLALDGAGLLYVTGATDLARLPPYWPTTPGAFQANYGGGPSDGYFAEIVEGAPISANDAFVNRIALSGARMTVQANNQNATAEPGEPAHAGFPAAKSLWWSWTAPSDGKLEVTTASSGFDTVLAVYTGSALANLQNVASNDDEASGLTTSRVRFPVTGGASYQIAVDGKGASGSISLSLTFSAPTNDDFANRATLSGFPVSATGSNVDATLEVDELIAYYGFFDDRSIWWTWTSPVSGDVAISTLGSDFDTELLVFTGYVLTNLTVAAVNDNETNNVLTSRATLEAATGTTYQICVRGVDNGSGAVRLAIGPTTPPANDDFTNSAVLTGTLSIETNYNVDATIEPGEPTLGGSDHGGKTLWWSWAAPSNGWLRVSTEGSDFDTQLGVFTGSQFSNLTLAAYNNDERPNFYQSRVDLPVTSNTVYHIVVDGTLVQPNGKIVLTVFFYQPPIIAGNSVGVGPGGAFHFHVIGTPGLSYLLETSTNLTSWAAPSGQQLDSGAGFDYTDPAPVSGTRFYRVKQAP